MLEKGLIKRRTTDGKFYAEYQAAWNTPWVHVKHLFLVNCHVWKNITFHEIVEKQLPPDRRFVPAGCQACFKVVVRPQTVKQLFALEQLQIRLDHPSKCGIEIRPAVFGNYGGYFYNRSLDEGLECYKRVRRAVSRDRKLGKNIPVFLKRACTEMEHAIGPSNQWQIMPGQIEFEQQIQYHFADVPVLEQADDAKEYVRMTWLDRAYDIGDETVLEYNDGMPLYPAYVTYHHLAEQKHVSRRRVDSAGDDSSSPGETTSTGGQSIETSKADSGADKGD